MPKLLQFSQRFLTVLGENDIPLEDQVCIMHHALGWTARDVYYSEIVERCKNMSDVVVVLGRHSDSPQTQAQNQAYISQLTIELKNMSCRARSLQHNKRLICELQM